MQVRVSGRGVVRLRTRRNAVQGGPSMIVVEEVVDTARQTTSMPLLVPRSDASRALGRSASRIRAVGLASPALLRRSQDFLRRSGRTCMKTLLIVGIAFVLTMPMNVATAASSTSSDTGNAAPASELDEVIVTGTRRQDRTVAESSAPIDVLTGTELANYPSASMLDTLSNLVPSFIEIGRAHV